MVSSKSSAVQPHQIAEAVDGVPLSVFPIPVSAVAALKVAINRHVKNKIPHNDKMGWQNATRLFENLELAPEDFIREVSAGFAVCAWMKGYRKSSNFLCMQVLAVDVDSDLTIDEALAHPFFQKYGWFIYTTPSHRPDAHRFRIVFLMERTIETEKRMRLAYTGIVALLGGDKACTDATRIFFGSENCEIHNVGHVLPMEQVEYLIELGESVTKNITWSNSESKASTGRSSIVLARDELIRTEDGGTFPIHALKKRTRIFCPVHRDKHASAMIVTSKTGQNGAYCSTCAQTYWPEGNPRSHLLSFDFNTYQRVVEEIGYEEEQHPSEWLDAEAPAEYRDMTDPRSVFLLNTRRLGEAGARVFSDGVHFIKSPKGTGKTYWLEEAVPLYKAQGKSVLVIVHRQALASALAARLGMHCYLDSVPDHIDPVDAFRYYVVCLDSMHRYLKPTLHKFDVVLIDESEQVYSHVLSSTLNGKRKYCFEKLHHYVARAKQVILCDADLGWLTLEVTTLLREDDGREDQCPAYFYVNRYRKNQSPSEARYVTHLYGSFMQLLNTLVTVVRQGGKQFVACNSKEHVKTIKEVLASQIRADLRINIITSENSTTDAGRSFIRGLKDTTDLYDVLIVSPSVGTGVDISVDDDKPQFTHVFGFFEAGITTHFEMDQQLARVRDMPDQHVWISPKRAYLEYEFESIRQSVLDRGELPEVLKGYNWAGRPTYDENSKLIDVYAHVRSMQHASLNNVRHHFIELKRHEGWDIHEVSATDEDYSDLKKVYRVAKNQVAENEIMAIVSAVRIPNNRYLELLKKQDRSLKDRAEIARHAIEKFYGVKDVTVDLVRLDDHGRYRECVKLYSIFTATDAQRTAFAIDEQWESKIDQGNTLKKCDLLEKLLRPTGLIQGRALDMVMEIDTKMLGSFVEGVRQNMQEIGLVLGVSMRADLGSRPMSQVSSFMDMMGLKLKVRVVYEGAKKKVYKYTIDPDSVETIKTHSRAFRKNLPYAWVQIGPDGEGRNLVTRKKPAKRTRFVDPAKQEERIKKIKDPKKREEAVMKTFKRQPKTEKKQEVSVTELKPIKGENESE
ncbi:plasmid replication protein, CyRepA1 family [Paraburkholderia dipogonis]|uniref:plasmid replication protein, CyRepA1 family n=1 Tax=Paraburkholderia dipogonis TaxID=1211383 RepID=UPI0038BD9DAC